MSIRTPCCEAAVTRLRRPRMHAACPISAALHRAATRSPALYTGAGLLLARAGVAVTVLEKHKDFLRDFRGDTVHPSTLELFHEIGLLDDLLKLPHARFDTATLDLFGHRYTVATLRHLPVAAPYIAMMPQRSAEHTSELQSLMSTS